MWQSPPFKISQPEQATCHNPCTNKLSNGRVPRHHLHLQNRNPNFPPHRTTIFSPPSSIDAATVRSKTWTVGSTNLHHRAFVAGKWQLQPSFTTTSICETLILREGEGCHVSASQWTLKWSKLVNTGQLVKVSSQLWSKLQKWLNKRGRIVNLAEIKLLIN